MQNIHLWKYIAGKLYFLCGISLVQYLWNTKIHYVTGGYLLYTCSFLLSPRLLLLLWFMVIKPFKLVGLELCFWCIFRGWN